MALWQNPAERAEWLERYKLQREIDIQSFKLHWPSVLAENVLALLANAGFGFFAGWVGSLVIAHAVLMPLVQRLVEACAK